jgi:hypothetical protein
MKRMLVLLVLIVLLLLVTNTTGAQANKPIVMPITDAETIRSKVLVPHYQKSIPNFDPTQLTLDIGTPVAVALEMQGNVLIVSVIWPYSATYSNTILPCPGDQTNIGQGLCQTRLSRAIPITPVAKMPQVTQLNRTSF